MADRVTWTGKVTGTGSAIDVKKLGFRPRAVRLENVDGNVSAYWNDQMPDAAAVKEITDGTKSYLTSNGITPLANGFTIGADGDINVDGEVVIIEACD